MLTLKAVRLPTTHGTTANEDAEQTHEDVRDQGLNEHCSWLALLGVYVQNGNISFENAHNFTEVQWEEGGVEDFEVKSFFELLW